MNHIIYLLKIPYVFKKIYFILTLLLIFFFSNLASGQTPQIKKYYQKALNGDKTYLKKLIHKCNRNRRVNYFYFHKKRGRLGSLAEYRVRNLCNITFQELNTDDYFNSKKYIKFYTTVQFYLTPINTGSSSHV